MRALHRVWSLLLVLGAIAASAQEMTLPEAVANQEELVERSPNDASLLNDLGNLLLLVDRQAEAEEAYLRAVGLESDLVSARFNLALLLHQTQRPMKARRELKKVLKIDAEHAWAHYQLGVLDEQLGRRSTAIKSYARALRLEPRLTDPAYNPHIVDNHLAASAILKAYADLTSVDLVPRTYEEPRRIAGVLIPMLPGAPVMATEVGAEVTGALEPQATGGDSGDSASPQRSGDEGTRQKSPDRKRKKRAGDG